MKYNPYQEIFDFTIELKEYKKLCRGRSKKYKYFSDWKEYIVSCLEKFDTKKDIDNFKHYCINAERTGRMIPDLYINYIILFITICIDRYVKELNWIVWLVIFILTLVFIILGSDFYNKDNYFYKDIVDIIEETETK